MASTTSSGNIHAPHNLAADAEFLETIPVLELHRSNVLRLETEELLQECRLDLQHVKWHTAAQQYISQVNTVLERLPTSVHVSNTSCPLPLEADKLPTLPLELGKSPLHVVFDVAENSLGMTTKQGNAKELPLLQCSIVLPNSLWANKDYLHHRYFSKRNLILWHILQHLHQHSHVIGTVQWRFASGKDRAPVMLLTPPTSNAPSKTKKRRKQQNATTNDHLPKKTKFQVEIQLKIESSDWIPSTRLFPNRSNLGNHVSSTPIYNHDLMRDAIESIPLLPPSCMDALILLKVWSLQRGFLGGHDAFGGVYDVAVLVLYLLRTKHVTPRMAPLEILAAWFKFVSETCWNEKALVVPMEDCTESHTIQQSVQAQLYAQHAKESPLGEHDPVTLLDCFRQYTEGPVLLNSSMTCNLWGRMSPSFVRHLQQSAAISLDCLHNARTIRPFSLLFLQEARFFSCMDAIMKIRLEHFSQRNDTHNDMGAFDGIARRLVQILQKALGDRVKLIRVLTTGNGRIESCDNPSQIPIHNVLENVQRDDSTPRSPTGDDFLVLGLTLNSETCHRVVDRGPPAEDVDATREFLQLWGKQKAQLRRFKDGAIVHAVVWNTRDEANENNVRMEGDEKSQGGILEQIVWHILNLHFGQSNHTRKVKFTLGDMLSLVDGVAASSNHTEDKLLSSSHTAFKSAMSAFGSLSEFLRQNSSPTLPVPGSADAKTSRLGVPLAIDAVEPLSPTLRYSEVFPPLPHPSLGGPRRADKKVSGVAPPPILIQIRFGLSSKWPTDLKAMGAAKTAMLIQLANGIESMKHASGFEGPIQVTASYLDVGYKGYSWRIIVRADPELNMLRKLQQPSPEALSFLRVLSREHVVSAMHHSMIHGINTSYPSSGSVMRLAKRWVSAHLLSDLIPFEAIELLVAKVYTNRDVPLDAPATVVSGFLRFLHLLASHDWSREALVVDPHGHITEDDHSDIVSQFDRARGPDFKHGPPMYIVSPNDRVGHEETEDATDKSKLSSLWTPTFTQQNPESVVLSRAAALAKRSHDFLMNRLSNDENVDWAGVFHETASSFKSYSALLRIDSDFAIDKECSSTCSDLCVRRNDEGVLESSYTRSMRQRSLGPKALRQKVYRNLNTGDDAVLYNFRPVEEMVDTLRDKFGSLALFFYNDLSPEVVAVLWRPTSFVPHAFSAMYSERVLLIEAENWKSDSLVIHNTSDILREMKQYTDDIVSDVKVLDDPTLKARPSERKRPAAKESEDESSSDDSD